MQWGIFDSNSDTGTINFPIAFGKVPYMCVSGSNTNQAAAHPYADKLPNTLTKTNFYRKKSNLSVDIAWLAVGYK